MQRSLLLTLSLGVLVTLGTTPNAAAGEEDRPLADCDRVLFLHWIDYSHHYACVDQDGDLEDGECWVGYERKAPDGSSGFCAA